MKVSQNYFVQHLGAYFNALRDREDEAQVVNEVAAGVGFKGANLWILVFAILIACLGLNTNSTAVIIGAMLISPLMGPIVGMGLAIGISDLALLKRSLKNYLVATVISVITAMIYFSITPISEAQSELLARTSPTLYDVLIALCGGAAGFMALATKGKGNVIPGVAIATALMPPLCTAGFGIAEGNLSYFFGAFYLFFINTVFICVATVIGSQALRFRPVAHTDAERMHKVRRYIIGLVVLTMVPATYMTVQIVKDSFVQNSVRLFVKERLSFPGTQIISQEYDAKERALNVVAVGKIISASDIDSASQVLENYNLRGYNLHVIQGSQSDSVLMLNQELNSVIVSSNLREQLLASQTERLEVLEKDHAEYTRYEALAKDIKQELKVLFPQVKTLTLSKARGISLDTLPEQPYVLAVIDADRKMTVTAQEKCRQWLQARAGADSLRLLVVP